MSAPELRRAIRLPHATALVVGTIIGASIFVQPSELTARIPSVPGVLLTWLLAGAITLIGALVGAELASTFTRTGGVYVYLTEAFGRPAGFLWGWAMFWSMHTGILAAIATVFARYAGYFVPLGDTGIRFVAMGAVVVLSVINYAGVKLGSGVQTAFTAVKVLAVLGIAAQAAAQEAAGFIPEPRLIERGIALVSGLKDDEARGERDGFYADVGSMITGSGWLSIGPGYRYRIFGDRALVRAASSPRVGEDEDAVAPQVRNVLGGRSGVGLAVFAQDEGDLGGRDVRGGQGVDEVGGAGGDGPQRPHGDHVGCPHDCRVTPMVCSGVTPYLRVGAKEPVPDSEHLPGRVPVRCRRGPYR